MSNKATEHVKANRVPYLAALIIPFIPLLLSVVNTRAYTDNTMAIHELIAGQRMTGLEAKVDLGLELQLAREIHGILLDRCLHDITNFNRQLERLQVAYRDLTGSRYVLNCGAIT